MISEVVVHELGAHARAHTPTVVNRGSHELEQGFDAGIRLGFRANHEQAFPARRVAG